MKIGRLEISLAAPTLIGALLGFLWLAISLGFWDAFLRWREIQTWRDACARDHGAFTLTDEYMSCEFPNGGRKTMQWPRGLL